MGSESTPASPPNLTDDKSSNPGSEPPKSIDAAGRGAMGDIPREASPPSVFVNSEPVREDQVQNAVKFLSHPKVRGSPVIYRRSFLEKKGLTKEEIDEAFRRVPDQSPTVTTTQVAPPNQDGQSKLATNLQSQVPAQSPQTAVSAPNGVVSRMTTLTGTRFHWSHAILAVGFLAASGAGTALLFKNALLPRLKSWIRKVVLEEDDLVKKDISKPSLTEEVAAAAKAAAAAAADVAMASQELLNSKNEEKRYHDAFIKALDVQLEELRSMSTAIRRLEGTREINVSSNRQIEGVQASSRNVLQNARPKHPWLAGPSNTTLSHPLLHLGQYDPRRFNPSLRQPRANSALDYDSGSVRRLSAPVTTEPPLSKQFVEPWEVSQNQSGSYYGDGSNSRAQYSIPPTQLNSDSSEPWWRQKNVRISKIEPEDESRIGSGRSTSNEQPVVRRAWIPPQPPPIAMPEAAAAIRQPKPSVQTDRLGDDKLIARLSDEGVDELQKITKLAESGGEVEINNNVNEGSSVTEIQEESVDGIETN